MRKFGKVLLLLIVLVVISGPAANWLVIDFRQKDNRQKADAIVILAGETDHRPALGIELLHEQLAGKLILNVPDGVRVYQRTQIDLAKEYLQSAAEPGTVSVCPIRGLSTKEEAHDAEPCLDAIGARSVLLVTSDFHTRRALATFQNELHGRTFYMASAPDARNFGSPWWRHRQWAKVFFDECVRLAWWELVDRWR